MVHNESWKPIYFGAKRSKVKVTSHKTLPASSLHYCECWLLLVEILCLVLWTTSDYFRSKEVDAERPSGSKSRLYRCPHCPYTNSIAKLVHSHKVMHSTPQLKCGYCGHLDHYPSRMIRHMRRRHRGLAAKYVRLGTTPTDGSTSSSLQDTTAEDDADGESTVQCSKC